MGLNSWSASCIANRLIPHISDKIKRSVLHGFGGANNDLVTISHARINILNKTKGFHFASRGEG
jgi:hypothetical protein